MTQGESRLSRQIMDALRARGIWCFKVHGGALTLAGTPDIIACVPACFCGRVKCTRHTHLPQVGLFIGFETKMPGGGDPSAVQKHQHNKIRAACGQVFVPRSVEDAVHAIDTLGWVRSTLPGD